MAGETVEVRLAGRLTRYASAPGDAAEAVLRARPGRSVAEVAAEVGIPPHEAFVAVVNGRTCDSRRMLAAGDRVTLLPPIAGG